MNNKFLIVGILSIVLGFIAKFPYRKFIYEKNIFDFGLADSFPSFIYIVGIIFIIFSCSKNENEKKVIKSILLMTSGALLYEFEQLFSNMTFDVKDVIATILGGLFSLALYRFIYKITIKKLIYLVDIKTHFLYFMKYRGKLNRIYTNL